MSFLGYSPNDYSYLLPSPIRSIIQEDISTPTNGQLSTTTNTEIPTKVSTSSLIQIKKDQSTTTSSTISPKKIQPIQSSTTTPINIQTRSVIATSTTILSTSTTIIQNNQTNSSGNFLSSSAPVNEKISSSVVNIYCQARRGSYIETITGSAVEVDPSGVYLTNAHVAIYVMLSDTEPTGTVSCYIREGNPVKKIYEARSVYVPSSWVYSHKNAYSLNIELTGTGEKDYALIKRGISNPNLKTSEFPSEWSSPIITNLPTKGQDIILSGYPVFDKSVVSSALYLLTSDSSILNIFDLNNEPSALFDSLSTRLAQIGSSGGGAFDTQGNLFGIMDAEIDNTPGELPSERIIGINYIKNDILKDTGKSFENIISNANTESQNFIKNSAPALSKILIDGQQ